MRELFRFAFLTLVLFVFLIVAIYAVTTRFEEFGFRVSSKNWERIVVCDNQHPYRFSAYSVPVQLLYPDRAHVFASPYHRYMDPVWPYEVPDYVRNCNNPDLRAYNHVYMVSNTDIFLLCFAEEEHWRQIEENSLLENSSWLHSCSVDYYYPDYSFDDRNPRYDFVRSP